MSAATPRDAEAFLAGFFAPPNRLRVASKPEIPAWADRLRGPTPLATVLPCWRACGAVDWYGLATDDRQFRALGEGLTAFVGPTYSTFRGESARLDPGDPVEAAVARLTCGRAYRFRGPDPTAVWAALGRLRRAWARAGPRDGAVPQPVGRRLRAFHMAALAGDRAAAEEALASRGAWLKLSGWYRLDAHPPYTELLPQIRRLAGLFGARMVWGSDWPHTAFATDAMPSYGSTWQPVVEAIGRDAAEALRRREPAIYR